MQTSEELISIMDDLPNMHPFKVKTFLDELENIVQFIQDGRAIKGLPKKKKKIFAKKATLYTLINGSLYKLGKNEIL